VWRTAQGDKGSKIRLLAWIAMLIASSFPDIILRQFSVDPPAWLPFAEIGALLLIASACAFSLKWRPLCGFILALAALRLGWSVIMPSFAWSDTLSKWNEQLNWGQRQFVGRVLALSGAAIIALTLIGSGLTRRDLFLRWGDPSAPAQPEPVLLIRYPIPWTRFGPILLVIFGVVLPVFLYFSLRPDFSLVGLVWRFLPWGIATAALNAANEEFQFRCVLLARLKHLVPEKESVLLTACFFGLAHYYGQPSGPIGVVLAGIAGWLWGKSMIETRGWTWAFAIHMVQDIVIFVFLAMTPSA
jgi:membrane protease YdiL (CAAX protease family)